MKLSHHSATNGIQFAVRSSKTAEDPVEVEIVKDAIKAGSELLHSQLSKLFNLLSRRWFWQTSPIVAGAFASPEDRRAYQIHTAFN